MLKEYVWDLSGHRYNFLTYDANSSDHDETSHGVAFHMGLHCLQKYSEWKLLKLHISLHTVLVVYKYV